MLHGALHAQHLSLENLMAAIPVTRAAWPLSQNFLDRNITVSTIDMIRRNVISNAIANFPWKHYK